MIVYSAVGQDFNGRTIYIKTQLQMCYSVNNRMYNVFGREMSSKEDEKGQEKE